MIQTGVDIVEVSRMKKFIDENVDNLDRVFSQVEIAYSNSRKNKYEHFAARFAAKEAVIKALDDKNMNLNDIVVRNLESGKPIIEINNKNYFYLKDKISISLSHTKEYAVAFVVIEK